jgi:MiaB-like tRNA modifying enzyme
MINNLQEYDITLKEQESDIIVVNSCTVTNGADIGVRQYITQSQKKYPNKKILLTGCGAVSRGESLYKEKNLFGVFGHSEKKKINELLNSKDRFFTKGDLAYIDDSVVSEYVGKTKAFIKIQEGCDFECSYCIIPSVRGKARSLDENNIIEQINILASNGYGEFVLTGTNTGSFGKDTNSSISKLIKKISKIQGVKRIRLGSLEPIQIDNEFKELLDESFMAKHLHIALQHTSNTMLEIMKRRNRFESDLELFEEIAQKGYALGTDYILGHAGENEEVWQEAVKNIQKLPLSHIHPFTYSKRDNTPSSMMKNQINGNDAKKRLHQLKEIVKQKNISFRKNIQKENIPLRILVENKKDDICYGIDQYFNKIQINTNKDLSHTWIDIKEYEIKDNFNFVNL